MNLNNFGIAEGRLTRDIVFLNNKDGSRKVKFTVAAHDNYKGSDGTRGSQFINFDAFVQADKETNGVFDFLHKGDLVKVHYTVKSNVYKDKDGNDVFGQSLLVQEIQLCENKSASNAKTAKSSSAIVKEEEDIPF